MRIGYLADRFGVSEPGGISLPLYNIAPGEEVPVIAGPANSKCIIMQWGLIPSWTKDEKTSQALINARAEGLNEKKLFRALLSHGRCIIPASGFYEWKTSGDHKSPCYFRMKSQEIFAMAGLCDSWKAPDGRIVRTFTIITTSPNSLVLPVHNRMPAVLKQEDEKTWLDPKFGDFEELAPLLSPYPSVGMERYRVTKKVNHPSFKSETAVQEEIPVTNTRLGMWDAR